MAMKVKPRIWVLATGESGTDAGGSGVREMVEYTKTEPAILNAEIVGVTSNYPAGGVFTKAAKLGIPFEYWPGPFTAQGYRSRFEALGADYTMCSGWLRSVSGLSVARTLNIHPALLPGFGGKGMWGHHAHEAVMAAFHAGAVTQSGVTMHFVTDFEKQNQSGIEDPYDKGPIIVWFPVFIRSDDTSETLAKRVNEVERVMQARVLDMVVHGHIWLDEDEKTVRYDLFATEAIAAMGGTSPSLTPLL